MPGIQVIPCGEGPGAGFVLAIVGPKITRGSEASCAGSMGTVRPRECTAQVVPSTTQMKTGRISSLFAEPGFRAGGLNGGGGVGLGFLAMLPVLDVFAVPMDSLSISLSNQARSQDSGVGEQTVRFCVPMPIGRA